jgi:hypothetical protein
MACRLHLLHGSGNCHRHTATEFCIASSECSTFATVAMERSLDLRQNFRHQGQ